LVIRAAALGVATAQEALTKIRAGYGLDSSALRTFLQQAATVDFSAAEEAILLDTLIERSECGYLSQFLELRPSYPLGEQEARLWALVRKNLASHRITMRRSAGRLVRTLLRPGGLKPPAWSTLSGWIIDANDVSIRAALLKVVGVGLRSGDYSADEVQSVLEPLREHLLNGVTTADMPGVSFLIEFGQRLKNTQTRPRKDTAVRWRGAMTEMLARASGDDQITVLDALSTMDEKFAASIVLQLEPWRHAAVGKRMNELLDDRRVGASLRRSLRMVLATKTGHLARYDWPELPGLLAEEGTTGVSLDRISPASG
jgi:hypothetical protein